MTNEATALRPFRSPRALCQAVTLTLSLALALGCVKPPESAEDEETRSYSPAPAIAARTVALPDTAPRPPALRLLEANRFSLTVQEAPLAGVLLGLARDAAFNAVIDPGVEGDVTVDLKDLSLREILDELLSPRGFHYSVRGNILRVFRAERATRTYRVDYPNYQRSGTSDLTISGAIASNPAVGDATASGGAQDSSSSGVQTTQVQDFWDELAASLKGIVFGTPGGEDGDDDAAGESQDGETIALDVRPDRNVIVSRHSGLVTITAEQDLLGEVEHYLYEMARSTQRQVLIDVRILEIDIGDDLDFGIDWEVAAGALDIGGSDGTIARNIGGAGLSPAALAQSLAPVLTSGGFFFGLAADDISAALSALAEQRDVKVVSTPRLATLNNHKALIKVVRNEVFFIAEVETQILEQVGAQTTTEFVPQVIPVGVTLDLTPQISDDGQITMHIHPSISEVVDIVTQPSGQPNIPAVGSLPVIDLRETDTVMRVADQETILIGGLIQSRELERQRKVPLLGDIPVLGTLFRTSDIEESRTELVILVTPQILDAPMISRVREDAERSMDALNTLRDSRLQSAPWWRRPFGESYGAGGIGDGF